MAVVYVDASVVVAEALAQPGRQLAAKTLRAASDVVTAALTEAELAAALVREGRPPEAEQWIDALVLLNPPRPLRREIRQVLRRGYVRGADCWHLATALWFRDTYAVDLTFLTRDERQGELALALGLIA